MWGQRLANLLKGVIGGAFTGLLVGVVIVQLTMAYVIQRSDYIHPTLFETAEVRYRWTLILSFVTVFILVGPFFAFHTFGLWVRQAMYGLLGGVALVVGIALLGAWIEGEFPFNHYKGSEQNWISAARGYGIPAAFLFGPVTGILIGRYWISGADDQ